jgi:acetylornithine deacetylase/succinyl-diaminopimelate desuccinylase-like protein
VATAPASAGEAARYDPAAEVVQICSDLIRFDTSNRGDGSGNGERAAAEYVAGLLEDVGISCELYEFRPRRTSVIAEWGDGDESRLLLHGHLDVVPAVAGDWQIDPFSGEVSAGHVWGRGAVDMKNFIAMILSVVRARARVGAAPRRPITLCFTADEEAGGHLGAEPLVEAHREQLGRCTEAVGEVGGFSVTIRGRRLYLIEAGEKGLAWSHLTARGRAGHASMLNTDNAIRTIATAVTQIAEYNWPVELTPAMDTLLSTVAELTGIPASPRNIEALLAEFGPASRMVGAAVRNTTTPSMLNAGVKVNVVPTEAIAAIDGRFLPDREDEFLATVSDICGDDVAMDLISFQPGWSRPSKVT